ncbi:MAG: hypothetical protein EH225_10970 [Calditrichaeota bacterium]|nr:MAG: hypothetical protein EH225_10970 [Calditrichota bacterium]
MESHDDYTLGDFIRIGLGDVKSDKLITDPLENARLTPEQMQVNKLAALFLFTCQGPVMIHEGQEYGRSKVIAPTEVLDPNVGKIDHNSYEKDNETNWLNFDHAKMNRELIDYYRGLIRMRNNHAAFRTATPEQFTFFPVPDSLFLAYEIKHDTGRYIVLLNGNDFLTNKFIFPEGNWKILADGIRADSKPFRLIQNRNILVPPGSGMVLIAEE